MNASCNYGITDINFLTKLKILNASGFCGINNDGIKFLNLEEFYVGGNSKITDVSYMTKLKILDVSGFFLNLEELNAGYNKNITDFDSYLKEYLLFLKNTVN